MAKTKTFEEIYEEEKIQIPRELLYARRVQRYSPSRSVDFDLDEDSIDLLKKQLPFDSMEYTFVKKMGENLIILSREKHRKSDARRLDLMLLPTYRGYRDDSFYYSVE